VVFVIESMRIGLSLAQHRLRNLFKRRELAVNLRQCPLQHLPVTGVASALKLLRETLPGKEQTIALPEALLLVWRDRCAAGHFAESLPLLGHFLLLLFDGLTLPSARHLRILP
jgi:hypothetical protein